MLRLMFIIFLGLFIISCEQNQITNQIVKVDESKDSSSKENKNNKPVIQVLSGNPSNISSGGSMTFTVEVFDPDGDTVKYLWSSTKGHLSATQGQLVHWTPKKLMELWTPGWL